EARALIQIGAQIDDVLSRGNLDPSHRRVGNIELGPPLAVGEVAAQAVGRAGAREGLDRVLHLLHGELRPDPAVGEPGSTAGAVDGNVEGGHGDREDHRVDVGDVVIDEVV